MCRQGRCLAGSGQEKGKAEFGEHGACCCTKGVGGIGPSGCKTSVLRFTQGRHACSTQIALQHSVLPGRHWAEKAWHASLGYWSVSNSAHGVVLQRKEKKHLL